MNKYRWVCHVCESGNAPELNYCSQCGFPAEASALEIEAARNGIQPAKNPNISSPLHRSKSFQFIVLEIIMLGGGVMAKFSFSLKYIAIGTAVIFLGLFVLSLFGMQAATMRPNPSFKRDTLKRAP